MFLIWLRNVLVSFVSLLLRLKVIMFMCFVCMFMYEVILWFCMMVCINRLSGVWVSISYMLMIIRIVKLIMKS